MTKFNNLSTDVAGQQTGLPYQHLLKTPLSINGFQNEKSFATLLRIERKRTERSKKPFILTLVSLEGLEKTRRHYFSERFGRALSSFTRETDVLGWHKNGSVIGAIFTELGSAGIDLSVVGAQIAGKISFVMKSILDVTEREKISISWHVYPEDLDINTSSNAHNSVLYSDLAHRERRKSVSLCLKRIIDIVGSASGLVLFFPVLFICALVVKFTSKGPVLFKQQRYGLHGKKFTFLKFRSMVVDNDPTIHLSFISDLIKAGNNGNGSGNGHNGNGNSVYKLQHDPRVTKAGRFLRKTSLDELPQLINVLKGDMSLVGPRPPIPYEYEKYDIWHRLRLAAMKPGITGLWQVSGRSSVSFDEMVRLDLRYIEHWSLLLDMKILLKTPMSVISCKGAY